MWNFETEPEFEDKLAWMREFVREEIEPIDFVFPKDETYNTKNESLMRIMAPLKEAVRRQDLWACHLPPSMGGGGWGQLKLALMNEILGRSWFAPTIFGTAAPDTGNSEILAHFGTEAQKAQYLQPLIDGDIVSCFSMTEPQGGADPKVFQCRAERRGDRWILNGEKWFSSNARFSEFLIVMAVTDPEVSIYDGSSMFIVPTATPGVEFVRNTGMGWEGPDEGVHAYLRYNNVELTDDNLLGDPGAAFIIAQTRLGGGRVHHAMRTLGLANKAFEMTCERVNSRVTQGEPLAKKQMVQQDIADMWMQIEQYRLLILQTAWKIDKYNDYKVVRRDIAACKVQAERVLVDVCTKAMHLHGSLGLSNELQLAEWQLWGMAVGMADGPTEVHKVTVARQTLRDFVGTENLFPTEHVPSGAARAKQKFGELLDLPGRKRGWVEVA